MTQPPAVTAFIIGFGDIGRRVAARERIAGHRVCAMIRNEQCIAAMRADGVDAIHADLDDPASLVDLPTAGARVYYFAPPPTHGDTDTRLRQLLHAIPAAALPRRVVYISTSGVYGDCGGTLVDETTPPRPRTDRARRRLDAEQALQAWSATTGVEGVILRVGGIYGPGRLPLERLRRGLPILHADLAPASNRIHADDLADICVAAMERGRAGGIYNVADDVPSSMSDYFLAVARIAGLPEPPQVDWDTANATFSAELLSYLHESRRLDTRRLRQELGINLTYPDLAAGLAATWHSETNP